MGSYTREFLDVTTDDGGAAVVVDTRGGEGRPTGPAIGPGNPSNLRRIQLKVDELRRRIEAASGGRLAGGAGTLYFPPGRYRVEVGKPAVIATMPFLASLVIPDGIEVFLAPGAVLVPDAGCVIDIQGELRCDLVRVFDLRQRGLVIFGQRVAALRPEWWGTGSHPGDVVAVQAALDAAIHNRRSFRVDAATGTVVTDHRLVLPVELLGHYSIESPLRIDGGEWSEVLDRLHPGLRVPVGRTRPGADRLFPSGRAIVRGVWTGRARQGATLAAAFLWPGLRSSLLQLDRVEGATFRGLALDATMVPGLACVVIDPEPLGRSGTAPIAGHDIGFERCLFRGSRRPMVEIDAPRPVTIPVPIDERIDSTEPVELNHPVRRSLVAVQEPSRSGADLTGLAFVDCDFEPQEGASAVLLRASQTLPMVLRGCRLRGASLAMLDLHAGTVTAEDCEFENETTPLSDPPNSLAQQDIETAGFEEPEGTDVYLRNERARTLRPGEQAGEQLLPVNNFLPQFVALNCVSRSRRVLSTALPFLLTRQTLNWPTLLLNFRHCPPEGVADPGMASVLWGLSSRVGGRPDLGSPDFGVRMGFVCPLVMLGGSFAGPLRVFNGTIQCVVVASRGRNGESLRRTLDGRAPVPGVIRNADIFGLRFDAPR